MGIAEIATLTGEIGALLGTVIPIVVQIRKIGNGFNSDIFSLNK